MAENDRDVLFSNESFVVGMLQVVSGGALVAGIAEAQAFINLAGSTPFLVFITAMAFGLISALLAAYWKHQYKLWDIKAGVSLGKGESQEAQRRSKKSSWYLSAMRAAFVGSLGFVVLGLIVVVACAWRRAQGT